MMMVHPTARISQKADIEESVRGTRILIGAESVIDAFVKIKPAGGSGDLVIGCHSYINSGCVLYTGNGIRIGDSVLIASNCTLAPVDHEYKAKNRLIREQGFRVSRGGITIEDDVWIGANSVILDGSVLRKGCVIGAGSIVRSEVASFSINVGNPLKEIGFRDE